MINPNIAETQIKDVLDNTILEADKITLKSNIDNPEILQMSITIKGENT